MTNTRTTAMERTVLGNGLRVLASPDRGTGLVSVAVSYDVGFRSEPEGRTGFAHLFEHLMFQGSAHIAKNEQARQLEAAGGVFNGHTRSDLTSYYEALPAGALEMALWLEADRMGAPVLNEENLRNQIAVVEEEIKVNVLNQPYGGFPWIVLPELAFDTYANSHNGYGDFTHLEEASVDDAVQFHSRYYSPSNAVLVVSGDCDPDDVFKLADRYFGGIAAAAPPPHGPWPEPPLQSVRKRVVRDPLAPQPAFVLGFRTPDPVNDLDRHLAFAVAASVMGDGDASRLRSRLMYRDQLVTSISATVGQFGGDSMIMRDPALLQIIVHHPGRAGTREITKAIDEEITRLAEEGPTRDELDRVEAGFAGAYWKEMDSVLERSVALSSLEVIHGRAELLVELPEMVGRVEPEAVSAAARDIRSQKSAMVEVEPKRNRRR